MYQKILEMYLGWKHSGQKKSNLALLSSQGFPQPVVQALEETVQELSKHFICSPQYLLKEVGENIWCLIPGNIYPYLTIKKEGEEIKVGYDCDIPRIGMVVKERFGPIPGVKIKQFPFNPLYSPEF